MESHRPEPFFTALMYHAVTGTSAGEDLLSPPARRYAVTRKVFADTIDRLPPVLDPADWDRLMERPEGGALITFDDALVHHVREALPELDARGIRAVFAVPTDHVGLPGMMGWADVKALAEAGHTIASHGKSHRLLGLLGPDEIYVELADSRRIIEDRIGRAVMFVALPGGSVSPPVLEAARAAGYRAVFTSAVGVNRWRRDLFTVRRFAVRRAYSAGRVAALAAGRPVAVFFERLRAAVFGTARAVLGRARYQRIHEMSSGKGGMRGDP